jgi:twitching motility protein PilJ
MQSSVTKLLEEVSGVADGDLTVEAEVTADMTGAIADSFNYMITQLRDIISDVQAATLQVSSSASEIRVSTEHLSQGSEVQAGRLVETSAAVDDMALSIQQVSQNAATSAEVGSQALTSAQQGVLAVENTIKGMARIRDQVQETAKRIKRLGEGSQEIGEIVQLIGDFADRTSILALNASIQAASAGEAGKGFAVVAEEVERLAEQSTGATKRIESLIRTIQNETNEAVAAMEATTKEVVDGSILAEEAGHALSEIGTVSTRLSELIESISIASQEQARGSEGIAKSVSEIAEVTQQTAAGTKQAAVSISNLANLADDLRASVSAFKLPDGDGKVPEARVKAT